MFAELNWMTFPDRVKFQKSVLMFKIFNNLTPSYLQDHFTLTSDVHQRPLRSTTENLLYVPKPNIELFHKSIQNMKCHPRSCQTKHLNYSIQKGISKVDLSNYFLVYFTMQLYFFLCYAVNIVYYCTCLK